MALDDALVSPTSDPGARPLTETEIFGGLSTEEELRLLGRLAATEKWERAMPCVLVPAQNEERCSDVTPERWQEVKAILAGALERAPEDGTFISIRPAPNLLCAAKCNRLTPTNRRRPPSWGTLCGNRRDAEERDEARTYEILARIGAGAWAWSIARDARWNAR